MRRQILEKLRSTKKYLFYLTTIFCRFQPPLHRACGLSPEKAMMIRSTRWKKVGFHSLWRQSRDPGKFQKNPFSVSLVGRCRKTDMTKVIDNLFKFSLRN